MDYHGQRRESCHNGSIAYDLTDKPQLPNFENFVRAAGHPDLALRGLPQLETAFHSPPSTQSPLPTPPSTDISQSSWLPTGGQWFGHHRRSIVVHDTEVQRLKTHRRASDVLPVHSSPRPRPTRAYSNTHTNNSHDNAVDWQPPVVIQEEDVPIEGACYVYDDGSRCPKDVNGDAVNPRWGTTKAGKPRKRLGQACNTCREKKMKCDPGFPKCSQCLRFNRECRFDVNARQSNKSPKFSTSTDSLGITKICSPKEYLLSRKSSLAPNEESTPTDAVCRTLSKSSNSVDDVVSPTMPEKQTDDAPTPSKRQRLSHTDRSTKSEGFDPMYHTAPVAKDGGNLGFAPEVDPIQNDAKLTMQYVNTFMEYVSINMFDILPKRRFVEWIMREHNKSLHDKMVIYALMAWGTTQSTEPNRTEHRAIFKSVIYQQLDQIETECCLQLVHTLLFLAFAEVADAQLERAYCVFVRCVGAMTFQRLHIEQPPHEDNTVYAFSADMTAECKRRTYWAAFITDIYSGLSLGHPRLLQSTDIYLKLPCAIELYADDKVPNLPYFEDDNVLPRSLTAREHAQVADMAFLIQIACLCGEIQLHAWRCQLRARVGREYPAAKASREKLEVQLGEWARSYNEALRAKEGRSADSDDPQLKQHQHGGARANRFAGLDILFHYAHMELNRRVNHSALPEREILNHARNATVHAVETLKLAQQLRVIGGTSTRDYRFVTRSPLAGYAIHAAVDIVTAAGRNQDILEPRSPILSLMYGGLEMLETLGQWWGGAKIQQMQVKERIQSVFNSAQAAVNERKSYFYCTEPMVPAVDKEFDLIYGSDRGVYLRAAYSTNNTIRDNEIYEISERVRGM